MGEKDEEEGEEIQRGGKQKPLSDEVRDKIKEMLREGEKSQAKIAEELGVSVGVVNKIKKETLDEETFEDRFKAPQFDVDKSRKILLNTPGLGKKFAHYIADTLEEAPNLQNPQSIFSLLVGIGKLNHDAATIATNRMFGYTIQVGPGIYPGTTMGAVPNYSQFASTAAGVQYPQQGAAGTPTNLWGSPTKTPTLTIEEVRATVSELLKAKEEDEKKRAEAGRLTRLETAVEKLATIVSKGTQPAQEYEKKEDPIELLKRIKGLEKEFAPKSDAVTDKLDELKGVLISQIPSGGGEIEDRIKELEVKLAVAEATAVKDKEKGELQRELTRIRAEGSSNLSVDDRVFKEVADTGIEVAKEFKKDLSETKKMLREIGQKLILEPPATQGEDWDRKKDLNEEELGEVERKLQIADAKLKEMEKVANTLSNIGSKEPHKPEQVEPKPTPTSPVIADEPVVHSDLKIEPAETTKKTKGKARKGKKKGAKQ